MGARLSLGPIPREEFLDFLNVQRLAHECWERLRVQPAAQLTSAFVDEALEAVVRTEYSGYARVWAGLTRAQKVALKAVIEERDLIRLDLDGEERAWRIEDPFLASWLRLAQAASTR